MTASRGYAAISSDSRLAPYSFERHQPSATDVSIDILYCGVCHLDIHIAHNEWRNTLYPSVPGHEIVGRVKAVGAGVTKFFRRTCVVGTRGFMVLGVLAMQGCATIEGSPVERVGSLFSGLFDSHTPKLKEYVDRKDFEVAHAYLVAHENQIDQTHAALLRAQIADGLNRTRSASAATLANNLDAASSKPVPRAWETLSQQYLAADTLLNEYAHWKLLTQPPYRAPEVVRLEAARRGFEEKLSSYAVHAFAQYDHAASPPFFEHFPLPLTGAAKARVLNENQVVWRAIFKKLNEARGLELAASFYQDIDDSELSERLVSVLMEALMRSRNLRGPIGPRELLQLAPVIAEALPGAPSPLTSIAWLTLSDQPGTDAIPHPAGGHAQAVSLTELPGILQQMASRPRRSGSIVVAPGRKYGFDTLRGVNSVSSSRVVGTQVEPNPEIASLQEVVREKERTYNDILRQDQELQRQAQEMARQLQGSNTAALGLLASGVSTQLVKPAARSELDAARDALQRAPNSVQRDITEKYSYGMLKVERTVVQPVGIYLVDTAGKHFQRTNMIESISREVSIPEHVSDEDPAAQRLRNDAARGRASLQELDDQPLISTERVLNAIAGMKSVESLLVKRLAVTVQADVRQSEQALLQREVQAQTASRAARRQLEELATAQTRTPVSAGNSAASASVAAGALPTASSGAGNCKPNLAHLDSKLPDYPVRELRDARQAILAVDITQALQKARAQGHTPAQAAKMTFELASNAEIEAEKGKQCMLQTSANTTGLVANLENGTYRFSGSSISGMGINDVCAAGYVSLKNSAIAMRELAVQMACHARVR